MHLIETYALSCGLKIDRPYVFEHFTSIPFEKFISFSKKVYPYYLEVIQLIKPELAKRGIDVLQVHATQENVEVPVSISDGLSFGQWAYLVRHSMLHFGEDDFLFDLAGFYDVPRVILFSNTYPNNFKPYWGSKEKERIIFNTGPHDKPTFSADIKHNFVRYIKPEEVAQSIMDLLGIPWKPPYETVFSGPRYRPQHDFIEIVPDKTKPITLQGRVNTIVIRMDYNFDEQFLMGVLEKTKAAILTNKPISTNLLHHMRTKVHEIAYLVDENSDIQFARDLAKLNLPCALVEGQHGNPPKERFFEVGIINSPSIVKLEDIKELRDGLKGLQYKSGKRVIHGSEEFKGKYEYEQKTPSKPDEFSPCPENAPTEFLMELDYFHLVRPLSS